MWGQMVRLFLSAELLTNNFNTAWITMKFIYSCFLHLWFVCITGERPGKAAHRFIQLFYQCGGKPKPQHKCVLQLLQFHFDFSINVFYR